ncbi:unnamed protein product [Oikopleura dioica]|uniref:Connexin N-terminal domain-containing protein n=1 Tax=Oikopleura dioica TaxID=34765 RepID=E4XZI0_OIKDI|nr:unnamed protein product [Oikopleura dioica]
MSFEVLAGISEKLLKYSTPFGHMWNALTFLCRLLPATTIGDAVYGDEMSDFDCVTTQPGCPQMCYNLFAPMSHVRYWSLHILFLSFPPLIFSFIVANHSATYAAIKGRYDDKKNNSDYTGSEQYTKDFAYLNKMKKKTRKDLVEETTVEVVWSPSLRRWYVIQSFAKMLLEIFGLVGLYFLQVQQTKTTNLIEVWVVPQRYLCTFGADVPNYACSQDKEVPCWVARPWEKTIFLLYMLSMGLVSIVVIMLDLGYTLNKITTKRLRRRKQRKALLEATE